jgi:hypothetical protein
MKKEFSFYEFTGTVIPGSTLILGLAFVHHRHAAPLHDAHQGGCSVFMIGGET